ncbi:unnamed protein product [Phytophthora lilii]|uniref:DNA-dependent protein kinase catalytic subunit n=1 Tax=Phytophthora lilii TaxID=2077276 RepID=A0A9W6X4Y5_9STRA|nr:unnamed protein product [Phytophthora lilii]
MDHTKYFDELPNHSEYDADRRSYFRSEYASFIQRACGQVRFYQDELLLTCAEFVLASPIGLVPIQSMVDIVRSILELGKSYLPAASVAISALERWQRRCPEKLEDVISETATLVSSFLDQDGFDNEILKSTGSIMDNSDANGESDLTQLQRRILLLLGRCGGKVSLLISEPPSVVNASGSMGSLSSPFFRLDLQLNEVSLSLPMDSILSHLGNLAANSSVRRVKASASECYHALVCYLCGKTATHPNAGGKKTVFYDMWRGVIARVLRLATDPEKICRSLFEPLLFQLLRWLATNSDVFPFEYASMLDELTRSLSDPETAVRTISARCIAKLLSIALEKTTTELQVDDIFERVFSLCRHPGAVQRSGAAASISYFLRTLNEEDGAVLTRFALPCVRNLLNALRLCDIDNRNKVGGVDISQDVISKAVTKIERGISRFPQFFFKGSIPGRKTTIEGGVLQETTSWLFQQTGAREVLFRQLCRRLFVSFSLLSHKSSSEWLQQYALTHGCEAISSALVSMRSLAHTVFDISMEWMEQLSASIESYVWCVELVGDKAEGIFKLATSSPRQESAKRKNVSGALEPNERNCQQTLAWAIESFLKHKSPWEDISLEKDWAKAYLSVLTSICHCIKSLMSSGNVMLRRVADVDDQFFQATIAKKLLEALLHRHDSWTNNTSRSYDEIEDFCAEIVARSQDWSIQVAQTVDDLLLTLTSTLTATTSDETFAKHAKSIAILSFFGSEILGARIVSSPVADKHAATFALVARKTSQFGRCLPESRRVTIAALKAAAACGWKISDIFVNPTDLQMYGPVLEGVINFIPTLAVWKRCASDLVSLSLTNEYVVKVLSEVIHQVASFKVYAARSTEWDMFTKTLVTNIKQFVTSLDSAKADTQRTLSLLHVLRFFLELCKQCSPDLVEALRIGPIRDIQDAAIVLLKQRGCSYLVKADILRILASLGPSSILATGKEHISYPTLDALVAFVFDEFPIVSTDVVRGSKEYDVYHLLYSELLGVIEQSGSIAYTKVIYPSLKEGDNHLFRAEIKQMLARFTISLSGGVTDEAQNNASVQVHLVELLDILLDPALHISIRKTLLEELFTPLIECQTRDTLQQFYLMKSPSKNSTIIALLAALISTAADVTSGGSRIGVFVAFSLVEILYRLLDPEIVRTNINSSFLGHNNGKGREFTMLVCKCASKVLTKAYEEVDDLTRLACCAAYSCLLTAVSRTQKKEKFFDQILFQPALWENILDLSREYKLCAETETFATIPLSSLSTVSLQTRLDPSAANPKSKRNAPSVLQFFTASSLSMDADSLRVSTMPGPLDVDQANAGYENVEIELDELNQHPCMIPLLRVLIQMKVDFGSSWSQKTMPGWMKKLYDVIIGTSTALNVRLFLAKMVLNIPGVFVTYASSWLGAVADVLIDASASAKVPEFSYVLRDCCNLVLESWKDVSVTALKDTVSRFITELIKLCPDRNNMIRDNNVLLVTKMITLWKDSVNIDVSILTTYLNADDEDTKMKSAKQFAALQTVSAMMDSGLARDIALAGDGEQTIEAGILLVMKAKSSSLYTLAAEVAGLYLRFVAYAQSEKFMCNLKYLILCSYNDEDFGRFLALLRNTSMHQPQVIDSSMLQRLSFVLPKAVSVDSWALLAADCLGNAARNDSVSKDVFIHAQSVLGRFIAHRHPGVQYSTLQAISRIVDYLSPHDLNVLITKSSEGGLSMLRIYEVHELSQCRGLLFAIAKTLYERDLSVDVKVKLRASLLHGLCDPDDALRKEAFEYWNTFEVMDNTCSDRVLTIFDSLYSQEYADKWVLYATNLLLRMAKESSDFHRPLFPSALSSGEYSETEIDAGWEAKTQSMAPLFSVETDIFSAHQEPTASDSIDSQSDGPLTSTMQSQLFPSKPGKPATRLNTCQTSKNVNASQQRARFPKRQASTDKLVVRDSSSYGKKASKRYFQDQYALRKKHEAAQVARERTQWQGQVSIQRTYRVGEFPDIQITQNDIVGPLMSLCEVHAETSSLVFGTLFSSVVTTPQFEQSGNIRQLAEKLDRTLVLSKTSSVYVDAVVSAYFTTIAKNPRLCELLAISPRTIGEAGLSSGKYHLSELALEERLIYTNQRKDWDHDIINNEYATTSWDLLHKLLSTVHKRNFLIALSMACSTTTESKLALQAQLSGDLPLAIATYKKAETMLDSQMEVLDDSYSLAIAADATRCRWQRFNCLETLNNWDALYSEIKDMTKDDTEFLWRQNPPYLEQGVGHYMRSCLGLAERSGDQDALVDLKSFVEIARNVSTKQELVQSRFPVEVCLTYLLTGDKNQARVCIENFYSAFLKTWRQISSMAVSSRMELMQSLSSIVEVDELLMHFRVDHQSASNQKQSSIAQFVNAWRRSPPSTEDGMILWSQHTMVQSAIASFLLDCGEDQETVSDEARLTVLGSKSNAMLQYANAAISCNVLALASKMLKGYRELCNANNLPKLSVQMVEVFVSHVLKLVDHQQQISDTGELTSSSLKLITRYYETATKMFDNVEIMNMMETAHASDKVAMGYLEAKTFASAATFYAANDVDDSLKEEYFLRSLDMFKLSCERINFSPVDSNSKPDEATSAAFLRCRLTFIEFLNDLLYKRKMEKLAQLTDRKTMIKLLAENILGGMATGDRECAHYFPQICDVIAPYPDIVAEFEQHVLTNVPLWTCLQWSAQLMALLNGPIDDNRAIDARERVNTLWKDCFSPDRPLLGGQIGRYNREWSRKAKRDVEKIMGKDGGNLTTKTVNSAREWISNHFGVTPGRYGITKDMKAHLGDFAEWLEEFDHSKCILELPGQYTAHWGPPDPTTHIRILSFDSMLGVLASKQLPKRLVVHCSDEKDYTFLVKGGEDLRLDQRIEQLFGVMNQILAADPRCRDQRLSLTTYNVVPMTQEIGILEWVDGTSTLKGVIEAQLQIDDRCADLKSNKRQKLELFNTTAAKAYETFLLKQRGASFSAKVAAPRSKDVVEQFAKVQAMIPGDLLRRQLLGLGSNFEAFLLVRDHFLKSLAVFNACSYVLGIGDRHLDNFLFDLSSGRVIGIDFGVSFGAGASALPVPELIPFRYTRQMDFVFQPYDGPNLLAQEMQAVFEALRSKRQVVESVMNVFLHEPLLDWQQSTTMHQKSLFEGGDAQSTLQSTLQDSDADMEEVEEPASKCASRSSKGSTASPAGVSSATSAWLPDVKIAIARRKLEGVSPGLLLKEELSQNPHLKQQMSKFHDLVDAACSTSEHGANEMAILSSLAQAQELLTMASAPDLLGRTFQGWMPWL